jgi:RND superfamily putative drug exporter
MNLAGRAGRWSAARWKRTTVAWFALTIAAMTAGSQIGLNKIGDSHTGSGETARAQAMLDRAHFVAPASEIVLVQARSAGQRYGQPAFTSAIASLVQTLSRTPSVARVRSPLERGNAGLVSRDGRSALVEFDVQGNPDTAQDRVQPALDAVAAAQEGTPSYRIEEFGMASANHVLGDVVKRDFKTAEYTSLPLTLAILLIAFGALVAAAIPVVLAFTAVIGSIGLYVLLSRVYASPDFVDSVILMMGMAVGVDYSLFYLQREREERRRGRGAHDALVTAASTSGQAVLISGTTVLIAMAGLFFAGNTIFTSMGLGTMVVVFVAMIGSVSVLPSLLHALGDNVDRGRIPFTQKRSGDSRAWQAILRPALARPALSAALAAGLLLAAASPALSMHTKLPSFTDLPHDLAIVRTYDRIVAAFPGSPAPAEIVVRAPDMTGARATGAIRALERRALASGRMRRPITVDYSADHTVARISLPLAGTGDDSASLRALQVLRSRLLPQTIGAIPNATYAVTGVTAATHDFNGLMKQRLPVVFAFVLCLAFVLLLLTFRSVVVPLTAICLNLLSVGAAYGLLVLVFQHAWAEGILGFSSNGGVTSWLPMFLFVVLFGLSMDYHVFIVSRIKELVDQGEPTEDAVLHGIVRTAPSVTSAALVMVAVFGVFASLSMLQFKQLGFGLAVAIAVDATVVRAVLLPSTMRLLGRWNWYLPSWLEWLPSLVPEQRVITFAYPSHQVRSGRVRRARDRQRGLRPRRRRVG